MKKGTKGVVTFNEGESKVTIVEINTYPASGMPPDYIFEYDKDEKYRPLINDFFGDDKFNLPEGLVERIFKKNIL